MSQQSWSLAQWLQYQEQLHPRGIDLGLDRVQNVARRMGLTRPANFVFVVAGTNGKGSTAAFIEASLAAAGYRVGTYSSPHLISYNERIRVKGSNASDDALCQSFSRIETLRGETSLTYFEFGTLAALDIFEAATLDVAVLEVGLGGRLDAVNIVDGDVAVITNIGLDHQEYLGSDRETIGREKAGIYRPSRPVVCGDRDPPNTLQRTAGEEYFQLGRHFDYRRDGDVWHWRSDLGEHFSLPIPHMRGRYQLENAATALMALAIARPVLPVSQAHLRRGLCDAFMPGRFEIRPGPVPTILDVAHNAAGASSLAAALRELPCFGKTIAIFGVMADKDIAQIVHSMATVIDNWYVCDVDQARAAKSAAIAAIISDVLSDALVECFQNVGLAYEAALNRAAERDRIVVFGSFFTVAAWRSSAPARLVRNGE